MRQMSMMTVHRNGSVSRDSVPVWKDPANEVSSGRAYDELPQRQHFPRFSAVADTALLHALHRTSTSSLSTNHICPQSTIHACITQVSDIMQVNRFPTPSEGVDILPFSRLLRKESEFKVVE